MGYFFRILSAQRILTIYGKSIFNIDFCLLLLLLLLYYESYSIINDNFFEMDLIIVTFDIGFFKVTIFYHHYSAKYATCIILLLSSPKEISLSTNSAFQILKSKKS